MTNTDSAGNIVNGTLRDEIFTTASGSKLAATVGGVQGAPAVILLHGGGQTRHSWRRTLTSLVKRGYHAIAYDARGHGDSDWSADADYGFERLSEDLDAVTTHIEGAPALVGASMGGMSALHAVGLHEPAWASALVLVDIAPRVNPAGTQRIMDFMSGRPDGFATVEEAADAVAAYNPHRPRPRDSSGLMKNLRMRDDGRLHWHWDPRLFERFHPADRAADTKPLLDMCADIKIPMLLVRGAYSDVVTDQGVDELRMYVPHLEVATVGGAGHMIAGDRNSAFDGAILPFLVNHVPPKTS